MYAIVYLIVFVGVFSAAFSKDIADRFEGRPEENPDLFEGDIKLTPEQRAIIDEAEIDALLGSGDKSGHRKATSDLALRWPNAEVPFVIASGPDRTAIEYGIDYWQKRTCVNFIPRTDESDYVEFILGGGCWSSVGRIGNKQQISIGTGCNMAVVHEIGHAIGFWHEHSRPDRDDYITVNWDNIQPGKEHNFYKKDVSQTLTENIPYDIGSVMHYGRYGFSKNDQPTITAKNVDDNYKIGLTKNALSDADIQLANAILGCVDCTDGDMRCPGWANAGECNNNPNWMLTNCKRSCSVCDGYCHDDNDNCSGWASNNECELNPVWMLVNCKRSCDVCVGLACTSDEPAGCANWAARGECENNPVWMWQNCKRSCGGC